VLQFVEIICIYDLKSANKWVAMNTLSVSCVVYVVASFTDAVSKRWNYWLTVDDLEVCK